MKETYLGIEADGLQCRGAFIGKERVEEREQSVYRIKRRPAAPSPKTECLDRGGYEVIERSIVRPRRIPFEPS